METKGYNRFGGKRIAIGVTADDCKIMCLNRPDCLAADYDKKRYRCFMHTSRTACNNLMETTNVIHFSRMACGKCCQ